jgi:hypothetical protein
VTYQKFYDDYERGLWMVGAVNENGILVSDDPLVDGLTGPQADAIVAALNAARALADELAEALGMTACINPMGEEATGVPCARCAALAKWEASRATHR